MNNTVIKVENLSKKYIIGHQAEGRRYVALRDILADSAKSVAKKLFNPFGKGNGKQDTSREEFWALKDVSFEINQGDRVGIIGRNGAGKSTLLKVLSRITEPSSGKVHISGRVASLLEVGTGFHPELTGRENVYLNGAILGMSKAEIKKKFDEIVEFAEIEKFLDTPVKRYSSGMYVRLAFAVAAHLEPEILLVDEVLAVGDAQFQKKCLGKMEDVSKEGRTVLFVSHNMPSIRALCSKGVLLENGIVKKNDTINQVIESYIISSDSISQLVVNLIDYPRTSGNQKAIIEAWIEDEKGNLLSEVLMGIPIKICFRFKANTKILNAGFGFGIENIYNQRIFSLNNYIVTKEESINVKEGTAIFYIPELPLLPGKYFVSVSIVEDQINWIDYIERCLSFTIIPNDIFGSGKILENTQGTIYVRGKVFVN